jgi:hypothetical protein
MNKQIGPGRPSKLTPELLETFCTMLKESAASYETICQAVRISYDSFRNWMNAGREGKSPETVAFFEAVNEANAFTAIEASKRWVEINKTTTDYRSIQAFLNNRHGWKEAPKQLQIEQKTKEAVLIDLTTMSIEEQDEYLAWLQKIELKQLQGSQE